jgi:hypothetical protein
LLARGRFDEELNQIGHHYILKPSKKPLEMPGKARHCIGRASLSRFPRQDKRKTTGACNDIRDHDGTSGTEHARDAHVESWGNDGHAGDNNDRHERDDGAALHDDLQEMRWRNEGRLRLRGQNVGDHASKLVQHDAGWAVQLLLHDERHDGLLLQLDDGRVQVRADGGWHLSYVHQWRPVLLRDDRGLLCLYDLDDEGELHLLPDDQQHASLLRLLGERKRPLVRPSALRCRSAGAFACRNKTCARMASPHNRIAGEIVSQIVNFFDSALGRTRPPSIVRAALISQAMLACVNWPVGRLLIRRPLKALCQTTEAGSRASARTASAPK